MKNKHVHKHYRFVSIWLKVCLNLYQLFKYPDYSIHVWTIGNFMWVFTQIVMHHAWFSERLSTQKYTQTHQSKIQTHDKTWCCHCLASTLSYGHLWKMCVCVRMYVQVQLQQIDHSRRCSLRFQSKVWWESLSENEPRNLLTFWGKSDNGRTH